MANLRVLGQACEWPVPPSLAGHTYVFMPVDNSVYATDVVHTRRAHAPPPPPLPSIAGPRQGQEGLGRCAAPPRRLRARSEGSVGRFWTRWMIGGGGISIGVGSGLSRSVASEKEAPNPLVNLV